MASVIDELRVLAKVPDGDAGHWLSSAESGVQFLKDHLRTDTTVLYASLNAAMIHGVLVPLEPVASMDHDRLRREFVMPDDAWAIEHASGGGELDRVYLTPPLRRLDPPMDQGEKLVFKRSFAGRQGQTPVEISQKLVHALDLHFIEERNAWCRLDEEGDLVDVIKIFRESLEDWTQNVTIVTIQSKDFAEYMCLAGMALLVFFDFTRTDHSFLGWDNVTPIEFDAPDLFYDGGVMGDHGSYVHGRMIVCSSISYEEIVREHMERRNPTTRQYATFKAIDLKTSERIEISADPKCLSNYFQPESSLPLEMSPAFFSSEVLHRYKADPVKYDLEERTVACRGAWSLRTYDVNKEGQVHTYLRYLGELPYKEQLYWQAFNEWPKGELSERAITTDFKGEVYRGYDPLQELKRTVQGLDKRPPAWWQPRGEGVIKAVRYPNTSSLQEWSNEVLALDQLVNEGFLVAPLKSMVGTLGIKVMPEWRAFKLLEECLAAKNSDAVDARRLISDLRALRDLRNHLKGHASGKKEELSKEAISRHGSYKAQFEAMARRINETLIVLKGAIG